MSITRWTNGGSTRPFFNNWVQNIIKAHLSDSSQDMAGWAQWHMIYSDILPHDISYISVGCIDVHMIAMGLAAV